MSGSEAGPVLGTQDVLATLNPARLAVGAEGQQLLVATSSGIYRLNQEGDNFTRSRISSTDLVADMQTDLFGQTWIFRGSLASSIEVIDRSNNTIELPLPFSGSVVSAAVSPEGARLAVLVSDSGQSIRIFGIVRNQQGAPIRLTGNLVVEPEVTGVASISWQQSTVVRMLSKTVSNPGSIYDYPISGPRKQRTAPLVTGSVIEAGFAVIDSYLLSEAGEVWTLSGNTWQRIQTDVIDIASGR